MKLLRITERREKNDKNGESEPQQEIAEVVLVDYNFVNNQYQHDSGVLCKFVLNKSFGQELNISPTNYTYSDTFHSEFSYIEVWFTVQNSLPLEIVDRINSTLVIDDKGI